MVRAEGAAPSRPRPPQNGKPIKSMAGDHIALRWKISDIHALKFDLFLAKLAFIQGVDPSAFLSSLSCDDRVQALEKRHQIQVLLGHYTQPPMKASGSQADRYNFRTKRRDGERIHPWLVTKTSSQRSSTIRLG